MARRYVPQGGTARRYLDTKTGTTISKAEYQKRQRGGKTWRQYAKERRASGIENKYDRWKRINDLFRQRWARQHNIKNPSTVRITGNSESALYYQKARARIRAAKGIKNNKKRWDVLRPGLDMLGLRDPEWPGYGKGTK